MERAHKRIARQAPREASRPGFGRRHTKVLANTHRFGRFTSPPRRREGFECGSPKRPRSPRFAKPLRRKVLRSAGQRCRLATVAWVLHDSRGNTFRFVVCRNSIQSTMALQLPVSNHQWQPHDEHLVRSKDRRPRRAVAKAELDHGSASRHDARPAGAPSSTRAIAAGVRLKWCGDELDPTKAEQVTWFVLSTVLLRKGWLSRRRARCRKAALNEQGTRGVRRKTLNRSQLERLSLEEWSRTSLSRRLPRPAPLRGVSVPEVRFESFAYCPPITEGQRL